MQRQETDEQRREREERQRLNQRMADWYGI